MPKLLPWELKYYYHSTNTQKYKLEKAKAQYYKQKETTEYFNNHQLVLLITTHNYNEWSPLTTVRPLQVKTKLKIGKNQNEDEYTEEYNRLLLTTISSYTKRSLIRQIESDKLHIIS